MPVILNARNVGMSAPNAVYVGRRQHRANHFGNPFSHTGHGIKVPTRDDACDRFATWLDGTTDTNIQQTRRLWILANIDQLRNKDLICWCHPLRCHAQTLLELANQ